MQAAVTALEEARAEGTTPLQIPYDMPGTSNGLATKRPYQLRTLYETPGTNYGLATKRPVLISRFWGTSGQAADTPLRGPDRGAAGGADERREPEAPVGGGDCGDSREDARTWTGGYAQK
eukprot:2810812-Rhodomonas_salina.2